MLLNHSHHVLREQCSQHVQRSLKAIRVHRCTNIDVRSSRKLGRCWHFLWLAIRGGLSRSLWREMKHAIYHLPNLLLRLSTSLCIELGMPQLIRGLFAGSTPEASLAHGPASRHTTHRAGPFPFNRQTKPCPSVRSATQPSTQNEPSIPTNVIHQLTMITPFPALEGPIKSSGRHPTSNSSPPCEIMNIPATFHHDTVPLTRQVLDKNWKLRLNFCFPFFSHADLR